MSDILFLLSGGAANTASANSLGGFPSNKVLSDATDALFPMVSKDDLASGAIRYRCLYALNTLEGSVGVGLWLENISELGASMDIGVTLANEIQQILLSGLPVGGTFTLKYVGNIGGILTSQITSPIQWTPDPQTISLNIANALNSLIGLGGISVTAEKVSAELWVYSVTFGGINGNKNHLALQIASNDLLGDPPELSVLVAQEGSPINAVAPDVGFDNQIPNKVVFGELPNNKPVQIGTLEPLDIFSFWLRRTVDVGAPPPVDTVDSVIIHVKTSV